MARLEGTYGLWFPGTSSGSEFTGYDRVRTKLVEFLNRCGFHVADGGQDPPGRVIQISHAQPFNEPNYRALWERRPGVDFAILYTTFESSKLPPGWAENAAAFDSVWTTSVWAQQIFREALAEIGRADIPVHIVQHGVEGGAFPIMDRTARPPEQPFTVFWKGMHPADRKGGAQLIDVFRRMNLRNSRLIIKGLPIAMPRQLFKNFDYPFNRAGNVTVESAFWTQDELRAALFNTDLFIQPTRCEGFGLEPLEALATGCPTAVTAFSGQRDYLFDFQDEDPDPEVWFGPEAAGRWFRDPTGEQGKALLVALPFEIVSAFYNVWKKEAAERPDIHTLLDPDHDYGIDAKVPDDDLAGAIEWAYRLRVDGGSSTLFGYFQRQAQTVHKRWSWLRPVHQVAAALEADGILGNVAWRSGQESAWLDVTRRLEVGQGPSQLPQGSAAPSVHRLEEEDLRVCSS